MPNSRRREPGAARGAAAPAGWAAETVLDREVGFLLARANAIALAEGNLSLHQHGLRARSYSVLVLSASESGPTQRELAEILRLDPSQVVSLVDELEKRELVERRPAETDRRANVVIATDAGRELLERASTSARDAEQRVLEVLNDSEQAQLRALLGRVARRTE